MPVRQTFINLLTLIVPLLIIIDSNGQCTSLPDAPIVSSPIIYCQGNSASTLTAVGENLKWYTHPTQAEGSSIAIIPSTSNVGTTSYYVSQTIDSCESVREKIEVTVKPKPFIPNTTTTVGYCQYMQSTPLEAEGINLLWYNNETGGSGTPLAPTPETTTSGITSYYVSQTIDGCESDRTVVDVIVFKSPQPPVVISPINYCLDSKAFPLTAEGNDLLWYNNFTNLVGQSSAYIPHTTEPGSTYYYVTQTVDFCESLKAEIEVVVEECEVLSITEEANGMITVYPNPSSDKISVILHYKLIGDQLLIIDKKGNIITERDLDITTKAVEINVSEFEPGINSITILHNTKVMAVKKFNKE